MDLTQITPLLLTYNEAPNLDRTLQGLGWARRIVVIDSYSTDATLDILRGYPAVEIFQRRFDSFAGQCNFGLAHIATEWTLSLDADYRVSDQLVAEVQALPPHPTPDGFTIPLRYCVFGTPLRGTLLPPRTVLYRTAKACYREDGHAHRVQIDGPVACLQGAIDHDDRKSLDHWLWAQDRYMALEVKKLTQTPYAELSIADKIRRTKVLAPLLVLPYCLVLKGGLLDGWRGWYYAAQRTLAELLLAIHLMEHDLSRDRSVTFSPPGLPR